jgi:hypothetical protein
MDEGEDAAEDVGQVGHWKEDSTYMVSINDGKVHIPVLLTPFLNYLRHTHFEG